MKKIIVFSLSLIWCVSLSAQITYTGTVHGKSGQKTVSLYMASLRTADNLYYTYTDSAGFFSIQLPGAYKSLIYTYPGYRTDSVALINPNLDIVMQEISQLQGVVITGKRDPSYISSIQTLKTEVITSEGLKKNACCNLAESFESNPTIDGSSADAVTGQRQIQMLGLSGVYVQMLTDMIPDIRGLNIITGLTAIPGPFIHNIYIRKGPGSVANSYEGITGQIDVELLKPYDADKFFINFYANTQQRLETNLYFRNSIKKWKSLTMLHGSTAQYQMDYNKDSFIDNPLYNVFTGIHRWQYINKHGKETNIGFKYHYDDAQAFNTMQHIHHLPDSVPFEKYLFRTTYHREEIFAKTCFELFHNERNEIGLQMNALNHEQHTIIGHRVYNAQERGLYLNSNFQILPRNEKIIYRFGGGLMLSDYVQNIESIDLSRKDIIPGLFSELTYDDGMRFSVIAGLRADYYNNNQKIYPAPRVHLRYKVGKDGSLRASGGFGWRVANVIQENLNYLVSSRTLYIANNLQPEYALNYGISYTQTVQALNREMNFSFDAYRTQFINQVITDLDLSSSEIWFYNLTGKSYANSLQLQFQTEVIKNLDFIAAVKWNNVEVTYHDKLMEKPFTPQWRGMFNTAYSMFKRKLKVDATLQWVGAQRIAENAMLYAEGNSTVYSVPYYRVLSQITYTSKQFEIYAGGENLTGFTQKNPIINPFTPYQPGFDAAMIWGPVMGRIAYVGVRYSLK